MARSDSGRCRKKIRRHPNPSNTRAPTHFGHVFTLHYSPQQVREIYTCSPTHGVPTPYPWIDVEKLVETVAPIALEFHFDQAGEVHRRQQLTSRLLDFRAFNGFHIRTGSSEIQRILTSPPGGKPGHRPAIHTYAGVGVLLLATPRYHLLDHDHARIHQCTRFVIAGQKRTAVRHPPGLRLRELVQALLYGWFQDDWKCAVQPGNRLAAPRDDRPRGIHAKRRSKAVGQPFIVCPAESV